jgi:hypothetical protein
MEKASRPRRPLLYVIAPACTTTLITLEPCALNAEFRHFVLRFNKFHYFSDTTERGDRG